MILMMSWVHAGMKHSGKSLKTLASSRSIWQAFPFRPLPLYDQEQTSQSMLLAHLNIGRYWCCYHCTDPKISCDPPVTPRVQVILVTLAVSEPVFLFQLSHC